MQLLLFLCLFSIDIKIDIDEWKLIGIVDQFLHGIVESSGGGEEGLISFEIGDYGRRAAAAHIRLLFVTSIVIAVVVAVGGGFLFA